MGDFMTISSFLKGAGVVGLALCFSASTALATDLFDRSASMKDAPEASSDRPELSANVAITNDYVFRGFSQTDEHAAIQGGFDVTYKMFYAGVWASNLDFGGDGNGNDIADIEIDVYAGIKHKWQITEFDLGVIYYAYPDAVDPGAELDYVEIKFATSTELSNNISVSTATYYSPEYTGETGETLAYEGSISVGLGEHGRFAPTFSALIGYVDFLDNAFDDLSYTYWNAGVEIGLGDKFALDLRYWGTDVDDVDIADDRFVATLSASF